MTAALTTSSSAQRLTSLDAVRGIAACAVILSHCYLTIPETARAAIDASLWSIPLRILHNGRAAVIIFFALSGYVLALPYWRGTQPGYSRFLIKRICRIYLPFAAGLLIAMVLYAITPRDTAHAVSDWFNKLWPPHCLTPSILLQHFAMLGTRPGMRLNPVIWSLVYEMRISIIFPMLMLLCGRTRIALAVALIMLVASTKALAALGQDTYPTFAGNVWITFLWTGQIAPYFITGILLSKHQGEIAALWERLPKIARVAIVAAPLAIFSTKQSFTYAKEDALYGLGAALTIVAALHAPRLRAFLNRGIPQWLGRISYSTYLIHLPILLALGPLLFGRLPFGIVVAIVVGVSLAAATLMHRLIEVPAIRLGQRLTRRAALPAITEPEAAPVPETLS